MRRSQRLVKKKEASEEEQILKLKRELDDLIDRRDNRLMMKRAQSTAATPSPCNPSQLLLAGATPSRCCPFKFPSAGPTPSPLSVSGGAPSSPCDPLFVGSPPQPCGRFSPLSAKKRKVVKTRLPEGLIKYYMENPYKAYGGFPVEELGDWPLEFQEEYAQTTAIADKTMEYRQVLINQFLDRGYADDYKEVFTDDAEGNEQEEVKGKN